MARLRLIAAILAMASGAAPARAQGEDPLARARTHYEAGRAFYELGKYQEALREFAAGYEASPRPQFLLNLGQCYRKLDDLANARDMYQRYLHDAPATDPERPQAQQILAEIDKQIAERQAAAPAASPSTTATTAAVAAESPSRALVRAAPPHKSWARRNWWLFPAGAVVVGVAVGLGVYYGTRSADPCSGANLACWDLSR